MKSLLLRDLKGILLKPGIAILPTSIVKKVRICGNSTVTPFLAMQTLTEDPHPLTEDVLPTNLPTKDPLSSTDTLPLAAPSIPKDKLLRTNFLPMTIKLTEKMKKLIKN